MNKYIISYLLQFGTSNIINIKFRGQYITADQYKIVITPLYKICLSYCIEFISLINNFDKSFDFQIYDITPYNYLTIKFNNIMYFNISLSKHYENIHELWLDVKGDYRWLCPKIRKNTLITNKEVMELVCRNLYDFTF